jgi:hypothetical protein
MSIITLCLLSLLIQIRKQDTKLPHRMLVAESVQYLCRGHRLLTRCYDCFSETSSNEFVETT